MGTRSLLGYERKDGKIYYQYLQFDGYPECQGKNFYVGVLKGLRDFRLDEKGPDEKVFKRIKTFLDEAQYQSGHSVGNHHIVTKQEWFTGKIDSWQEWQYLFRQNGDFVYFHVGSKPQLQVVIPWAITSRIRNESHYTDLLEKTEWWHATRMDDYDENVKVLTWGKAQAALHVGDEFEFESSKALLEKLLKGEEHPKIQTPVLSLEYGEVLAFPENIKPGGNDDGYRDYSTLTAGTTGKTVKAKDTFGSTKAKKRNQGKAEAQYLRGNECYKE